MAVLVIAVLGVLGYISKLLYNLLLHPLAGIPGPKTRAASRLPLARSILSGSVVHDAQRLHALYGPIVRTAPDEISLSSEPAWHILRGDRFLKDPVWWGDQPGLPASIVTAIDPPHHRLIRRAIAPSLTAEAVKAQEQVLQRYTDLLVQRLREGDTQTGVKRVNVVQWLNFTTFDLFGALYLGRSFDCLTSGQYHPWIALLFGTIKVAALVAAARLFPLGQFLLLRCIPPALRRLQVDHYEQIVGMVRRRLNMKDLDDDDNHGDLMARILREEDWRAVDEAEFFSTFMILTIAGSETTGTTLSGTIHYLLRNPGALRRLTDEVRARFGRLEELSLDGLSALPYLDAVIKEGLRLCPPIPSILPRRVPSGGETVCGRWLPGGTAVSIQLFAMNRDEQTFHLANSFIPERWLDESTGPARRGVVQSFGVGPRACPGRALAWAEMRLIVAKLVFAFDLSADMAEGEGEGGGAIDWADQRVFVLWEKRPIEVTLRARDIGI